MLNKEDLEQFTGSTQWYKHWTGRLIYTEGVHYVAEHGGQHGAYWLVDAIASWQTHKRIRSNPLLQEFQLWTLKVKEKDGRRSAVLTMQADSDQGSIIRQRIELTDFELDELTLYVEGDTLLLPSEH